MHICGKMCLEVITFKDVLFSDLLLLIVAYYEKAYRKEKQIYHYFVDFQKALDIIRLDVMGNAECLWSEKKTDSADEEYSGKRSNSSMSR